MTDRFVAEFQNLHFWIGFAMGAGVMSWVSACISIWEANK